MRLLIQLWGRFVMQEYKIDIVLPDGNIEKANVEENTKIEELAKKYNPFFKNPIILSIYNGKLRELCKKIDRDGKIEFLTIADRDGRRTYRRSVILLLQRAVQKLYGDEVELKVLHSLGEGYYCEIINLNKSVLKLHEDDISSIKKTMDQLVQQNIPITKSSEKTQTAEEMFAGLGASRVRKLFDKAKKMAPAIIFIDEIDAIGSKRSDGSTAADNDNNQTLNQLLVEMDGFDSEHTVILLAATNRPDMLDQALLRPGRFDRQIVVGLPDVRAREQILEVHARKKKLADDIDLKIVAKNTAGFSGADLENVLNEDYKSYSFYEIGDIEAIRLIIFI